MDGMLAGISHKALRACEDYVISPKPEKKLSTVAAVTAALAKRRLQSCQFAAKNWVETHVGS